MTPIIAATLFVVANWTFNPIVWKAEDGGLTATAQSYELAIQKGESLYKKITVSAEVTVAESLKKRMEGGGRLGL